MGWIGIERPDVRAIELGEMSDFKNRKDLGSFACCSFILVYLVVYPILAIVGILHAFTEFYRIAEGYLYWLVDASVFAVLLLITMLLGPVRHKFPLNFILLTVLITVVVLVYIKLLLIFGNVIWGGAVSAIMGLMTFSAYTHYFTRIPFSFLTGVLLNVAVSACFQAAFVFFFDAVPMTIVGVIVQCTNLYILGDIYLISTGKHYYGIKPKEYIVAAFHLLFIDVFTCFLYMRKCRNFCNT